MKKYLIFLLLSFSIFQSQKIENKQLFKKCKKEYSKKICLSDEDQDGILFYLDKCPKESGSIDNEGCPWPDTDGDGVLDKDDNCPTYPAATRNGCPDPDCEEYLNNEKKKFEEFKVNITDQKERFTQLRNIIFNTIPKKFLPGSNIIVSIHVNAFINDHITNCASRSSLGYNKLLFLDQFFWNEETFKYLGKKLKKNIFPTVEFGRYPIMKPILESYQDKGYYAFIESFSKTTGIYSSSPEQEIFYYPGSTQKPEFKKIESLRIRILFGEYEHKNRVTIEFVKNNDFQSFTYEYQNGKWNMAEQESHHHYNR